MTKNPIKYVRNPNSPEAIQARLDGYETTEEFGKIKYITDPNEKFIFIDHTQNTIHQRANYTISGGIKTQFNKKLVRSAATTDSEGRMVITSYYTDVLNHQWIVIKSFRDPIFSPSPLEGAVPGIPVPRPSFGFTHGGIFSSARGETWVNEGRSVDKIREAQKRIFPRTVVEADNQEKELPQDRYFDDFNGER